MRYYSSTATVMALTAPINEIVTTIVVDTVLGLPAQTPFTLVVDVGLSTEEIVTVTGVAGTSLTVTRGEDGSTAIAHSIGVVVRHMMTARDLRESAVHVDASANVHGIGATASVVGTDTVQALTNKTLNFANNTVTGVPQVSVTGLVDDLAALTLADSNHQASVNDLVDDTAALQATDTSHTAAIADTNARVTTLEGMGASTAYTPVLTSNGLPTSGYTSQGTYVQNSKQVSYWYQLNFGALAATVGAFEVSLPVPAVVLGMSSGSARFFDASSGNSIVGARVATSTANTMVFQHSATYAGTLMNSGYPTPWAWAVGDIIDGFIVYEAA